MNMALRLECYSEGVSGAFGQVMRWLRPVHLCRVHVYCLRCCGVVICGHNAIYSLLPRQSAPCCLHCCVGIHL